ncbi:MAG: hypothetical protein WDN02_07465 [Methylovirgula sp.]|uniref:hypothetical protein n=1 Tax=Methylovirgula sp. TaxID=1978224 RepID=UPI0030766C22
MERRSAQAWRAATTIRATAIFWLSKPGAQLSGMEFSGQYGITPKGSACTKTAVYGSSTMRDASGQIVRRGKGTTVAEIETGHVYCVLDGYDERGREDIQRSQPDDVPIF